MPFPAPFFSFVLHVASDGPLACLFDYWKALKSTPAIGGLPGFTALSRHTLALISQGRDEAKPSLHLESCNLRSPRHRPLADDHGWYSFLQAESQCFAGMQHIYRSSGEKYLSPASTFQWLVFKQVKRIKGDLGFQGLPGRTNCPLPVALVTCLCPPESSAEKDESETSFFCQRAVNLGNPTWILQQRLWLIGYFGGIFVNTDTIQSVNCLQCQHWQTVTDRHRRCQHWLHTRSCLCAPEAPSQPSPYSSCRYVAFGASGKEIVTLARVEMWKPAFLETCLDTQESGALF